MLGVTTYSFLDVHLVLEGPGGAVSLGASSATAKEGITIEPVEEVDTMQGGADGSIIHSLHAAKTAKAIIRLLKTSPVNQQLSGMLALQRSTSLLHGQNTLVLSNPVTGDVYTGQSVAFARVPSNTWAEDAGMIEWTFNIGILNQNIGGGINTIGA